MISITKRMAAGIRQANATDDEKFLRLMCDIDHRSARRDEKLDNLIAHVRVYRAAHLLDCASRRPRSEAKREWLAAHARKVEKMMTHRDA